MLGLWSIVQVLYIFKIFNITAKDREEHLKNMKHKYDHVKKYKVLYIKYYFLLFKDSEKRNYAHIIEYGHKIIWHLRTRNIWQRIA